MSEMQNEHDEVERRQRTRGECERGPWPCPCERHAATLLENLTRVQARCTGLLNANRLAGILQRRSGDASAFVELAWNVERARLLHPKGPDGVRALAEELGEVADAIRRRTASDVRAELLDLATVALRLYMGEHRPGALDPVRSDNDADFEDDSFGERTARSSR